MMRRQGEALLESDPGLASPGARDRYDERFEREPGQPVGRRGTGVRRDGVGTRGPHRREKTLVRSWRRAREPVQAAGDATEPTRAAAVADRRLAQPESARLFVRDQAVLVRGQRFHALLDHAPKLRPGWDITAFGASHRRAGDRDAPRNEWGSEARERAGGAAGQRRPTLGRLPWLALLRRARSLRFFVFLLTTDS
jgi:hypothetical protein